MKIKQTSEGLYLRTDEREDVIASLEICVDCLDRLEQDPRFLKWLIFGLYDALQGAMVCHLSGTAQIGALSDSCAKKWLNYFEKSRNDDSAIAPNEYLADYKTLRKRLIGQLPRIEQAGDLICINAQEQKSLDRLHKLRRNFAHFSPKGWSIELSGIPMIVGDACSVMLKIADDPWPFRHVSKTRQLYIVRRLRKISRQAKELSWN